MPLWLNGTNSIWQVADVLTVESTLRGGQRKLDEAGWTLRFLPSIQIRKMKAGAVASVVVGMPRLCLDTGRVQSRGHSFYSEHLAHYRTG